MYWKTFEAITCGATDSIYVIRPTHTKTMLVSKAGWAGARANLNAAAEQLQAAAEGLEAYYQQVLHGGEQHEPTDQQAQDRLSMSVRSALQDHAVPEHVMTQVEACIEAERSLSAASNEVSVPVRLMAVKDLQLSLHAGLRLLQQATQFCQEVASNTTVCVRHT